MLPVSPRGVAQHGRALRSGRRGRWFESSRPDERKALIDKVLRFSFGGPSSPRLGRRGPRNHVAVSTSSGKPVFKSFGQRAIKGASYSMVDILACFFRGGEDGAVVDDDEVGAV